MKPSEIPAPDHQKPGVLADLPRRKFLKPSRLAASPAQMRFMDFKFSRIEALYRTFLWFSLLVSFTFSTLTRQLFGDEKTEQRAQRLRKAFEKRGGAFVKLGIHLSMRVDFLPWEYAVELSKMTDRMDPFPVKEAIKQIERAINKPLSAVFSRFDPEPIDSSSTACIYQARFHDNQRVIVKIRRPGVGEQFMADLQAFDWLMMVAEILTIFKPGFTRSIREEFRSYLLDELDFLNEARRQDMFRRVSGESGKNFFSGPKVYLEYSSEAVVVEEFVSGMWLWEILAAVEHNDTDVLEYARSINILPEKVAKRLLWVRYWSLEENLFYSPDTHPDNIIVGKNSRLYYVNFSATGRLNRSKRQAMQQILYYIKEKDPQNMARGGLILLEPLPPVDLIQLAQELESYNLNLLYALEARPESLTWQERTTSLLWVGLIRVAKKHEIAIDMQVLQHIRSTLLSEASAVRLCHDIDLIGIYNEFEEFRTDRVRRRVTDGIIRQLDEGLNERLILQIDRVAYTLQGLFFRARHMLTLPSFNFNALMGKWSFAVYMFFRFITSFIILTGVSISVAIGSVLLGNPLPLEPGPILNAVFSHPIFHTLTLILIIISGRSVLFRLEDKEV